VCLSEGLCFCSCCCCCRLLLLLLLLNGVCKKGAAANFVETEQLVTLDDGRVVASYVQVGQIFETPPPPPGTKRRLVRGGGGSGVVGGGVWGGGCCILC
jgi:hypothetical protein